MAEPTVEELLTLLTTEQLKTQQLAFCAFAGFPVESWATTSVPRVLIAADVDCLKTLTDQVPTVVKMGTLRDSLGSWLDLKLRDFPASAARVSAVKTVRNLRLADDGGGPLPLTTGSVVVVSDAGLRYLLNEDVVVPGAGGNVDAAFIAEEAGAAHNAATTGFSFETAIPGVELSEPGIDIVTAGADAESDASAKQRARALFPGLGGGANDDVYVLWAKAAAPTQVTRVAVARHYPDPGQVTVALASAAGPVSGGVATTVEEYIDPRAPNCIDAFAQPATDRPLALTGTIYFLAAEAGAQAAGEDALNDLAEGLAIGSGLPIDLIVKCLRAGMTDDPRNDVDLDQTTDYAAGAWDEVITFDLSGITWTAI
jgi:hypothetical protein